MGGLILVEPDETAGVELADINQSAGEWAEGVNIALDTVRVDQHDPTTIGTGDNVERSALDEAHQPHVGGSASDHPYLAQNQVHPDAEVVRPSEPQTSAPRSTSDRPLLLQPTPGPPVAETRFPEERRGDPMYPWFLTYEMLERLLKIDDLDFEISIKEEEIEDKSKGDLTAKAIACLQIIWFIIQCLARLPGRLDWTQLELITLALASVNAFMYYFWIDKPLDVKVPVKVNLKRRLTAEERSISDQRERVSILLLDKK